MLLGQFQMTQDSMLSSKEALLPLLEVALQTLVVISFPQVI